MEFETLTYNVNEGKALIYMWETHDEDGALTGRYVGKAKGGSKRPRQHYKRNVRRLLQNRPYRKSNPKGYRKVHRHLAEADRSGHKITLSFLCNIDASENINDVEQRLIKEHGCQGNESWQLND
ncbi:hypothetical protein CWB99_02360 [Pseudoalteromonas rubra]|uniref:GIY-YIG domain-containing protein n=1 Tax=Pseudoalteromonas rubra TaxID=43658 RepID=A0A5S3WSE1_9GAMM|nr:hypothetical protein [Pseudoalteromonas rubra]TMP29250.1 hypothetical protein CWC00_19230 [Pseudoalteromonas rubra]TMP32098.1 hypothetical protein CWB99_02360 [Pseudoalteromonas rubra]